jgi:hypothetical protein
MARLKLSALAAASALALMAVGATAQEKPLKAPIQIRIEMGGKVMTATLEDSLTTRDFVSLLPLTLPGEDHGAFEKITYLPRKLTREGAPDGVTPLAGDVGYYAPWGNLALFHSDFRYSPGLIRLGRFTSAIDALRVSGPVEVKIDLVD